MSVPPKRRARRRRKTRASHAALDPVMLTTCEKCKKPILPHHACAFCGYYRGRQIVTQEVPQLKKLRKKKNESGSEAEEGKNKGNDTGKPDTAEKKTDKVPA